MVILRQCRRSKGSTPPRGAPSAESEIFCRPAAAGGCCSRAVRGFWSSKAGQDRLPGGASVVRCSGAVLGLPGECGAEFCFLCLPSEHVRAASTWERASSRN